MNKVAFLCLFLLLACCGILCELNAAEAIQPARYSGKALPKLQQMTKLTASPGPAGIPGDLNIVGDYFCYSDERFYTAIQTKSGSFPKSGNLGTSWYSYMTVITRPGSDKTVWAMTYINVPMTRIKPGLYRIDSSKKQDLTRIGDIDFHIDPASSVLRMSCKISDLLADPSFSAWYNRADPSLGVLSMSSSTKLIPFGTKVVDSTNPGRILKLGK